MRESWKTRNKLLNEVERSKYDLAMKNYPIFKEEYRSTLNENIWNYYQFEQISMGNEDEWLAHLGVSMCLLMPKYNTLYQSLDLMKDTRFDPLQTYEFWREFDHTGTAHQDDDTDHDSTRKTTNDTTTTSHANTVDDGTSNSNGTSTDTDRFSDTPQGNLLQDEEHMSNLYLTTYDRKNGSTTDNTVTKDTTVNDTNGTSNSVDNTTEGYHTDYTSQKGDTSDDDTHEWGTQGTTYQDLVQKFRDLAIDIDRQIVDELDGLFATVFSVDDVMGSSRGYEDVLPIWGSIGYLPINYRW